MIDGRNGDTAADGEGFDGVSVAAYPDKGLPQSPIQGEAESEAFSPDSDLKSVVDAWATLPDAIKTGILALVRAAGQR